MDLHNGRQYRDQTNTFAALCICFSHGGKEMAFSFRAGFYLATRYKEFVLALKSRGRWVGCSCLCCSSLLSASCILALCRYCYYPVPINILNLLYYQIYLHVYCFVEIFVTVRVQLLFCDQSRRSERSSVSLCMKFIALLFFTYRESDYLQQCKRTKIT